MRFVIDHINEHRQAHRKQARHMRELTANPVHEYRWQLGKPIMADVDFMEPATDDLGNGVTETNILALLNSPGYGFDFDYVPEHGDSLTITFSPVDRPSIANEGPYMDFVYSQGTWHAQWMKGLAQSFASGKLLIE